MIRLDEKAIKVAAQQTDIARGRFLMHTISTEELVRKSVVAYEEAHPRPRLMPRPREVRPKS